MIVAGIIPIYMQVCQAPFDRRLPGDATEVFKTPGTHMADKPRKRRPIGSGST